MAVGNKGKLSPKQAEFVRQYLLCRNGAQAARKAGYSPKTAHEQAAQLLAKLSIRTALAEEEKKAQEEFGIAKSDIIRGVASLAFTHIGDLATWDEEGRLNIKCNEDMTANEMRFISSMKRVSKRLDGDQEGELVSFEFKTLAPGRLDALYKLWEIMGYAKEDDGSGINQRNRTTLLERVQGLMGRNKDRGGEG